MSETETRWLTVRQAAFIGVGAMVGAGIFTLLGVAGAVAGAAVWVSFLIAGMIAAFQGYSFAKLGSKFPSPSGMLEYLGRGFGEGHLTGISAWMIYASNAIVTAMVAVSFGTYASSMFTNSNATWAKVFACAIVIGMGLLNAVGSGAVAKAQTMIVRVVIGILIFFAIVTLWNMNPSLLAFSGYPSFRVIVSSVALTFFAFLGFGVITFTAKDLADPARELPRAMYLALGIATVVYIGIALGVFGTLTVDQVVASGGTALAEAAKPALGQAGYWLMAITALFATAGATNSGIYPAIGLTKALASSGQFPPVMGREVGRRNATVGMLVMVATTLVLAVGFDLSAIASIGSAVALIIFFTITIAHLRVREQTGARFFMLLLALLTTGATLFVFATTTLADDPASLEALVGVVLLSIVMDLGWKHRRDRRHPIITMDTRDARIPEIRTSSDIKRHLATSSDI